MARYIHPLWESHQWKEATEEEVISALFNAPQFIDPSDMGEIKRYHRAAIGKYQSLHYEGNIPHYAKRP